jgi:hypothetical protein
MFVLIYHHHRLLDLTSFVFLSLSILCYSEKNSKRARDLHLLKKLKAFLKENDYDNDRLIEEIHKRMQELKTNDIYTQAIEMLSTSKYITPDALEVALNIVVDKLTSQGKLLLEVFILFIYSWFGS